MGKLVCFGESLIDMLSQPPADAAAPRAFLQYAGGAPANVAVAAARLGADAHFVGMLGQDMFGDFLADSLAEHSVDTSATVRTHEARTALAFVALDTDGERSFSFYRPPAADLLFRTEHFRADSFQGLNVFHVCSNSLTEAPIAETTCQGMRRARRAGALVSMDLNLREALWPRDIDPTPRLWQALELADMVKLSRQELDYLARPLGANGDDRVIRRLLDGRAHCVIITDGDAPLAWHTRAGHGQLHNFNVQAVDTTGAGDAFMGGLLASLCQRDLDASGIDAYCADSAALEIDLRFATAVGALAVTRQGAFAAMPTTTEVIQLLQQSPEARS